MFAPNGVKQPLKVVRNDPTVSRPNAVQRSFDELGTPLDQVTFCVLDLETTGGSPAENSITEIGAVRMRGGERLGTFQTLVNPGCAIPPTITVLTGITESMVYRAPRIEAVLGTFLDFIGDAVVVGHNVRFDLGFIAAALERDQRRALSNPVIDTVALARRLVRDEVPNCRLGTLARHLRLPNRPTHRALDDALATADLLHLLLERAGRLGVSGLDDLRTLPTMAGHAQASKLRLTESLPRTPGVYLFRDGRGDVLYVGKATNLRSRVRSYFSTDDRRRTGALLRETVRIDHKRCADEFEAAVLEMRLIHHLAPRYNRVGTRWNKAVYVKLSPRERFPRLQVVRAVTDPHAVYLGPIASRSAAQLVIEAVHSVIALRQCTSPPPGSGARRGRGPCLAAQLGLARCPCTGEVSPEEYRPVVEEAVQALTGDSSVVADSLSATMLALADDERFEQAASVRDRLAAYQDGLKRQRRFDQLRSVERLVVQRRDGLAIEVRRGRLTAIAAPQGGAATRLEGFELRTVEAVPPDPGPPQNGPLPAELADELSIVARWLDANAARLRVLELEGDWSSRLRLGRSSPDEPDGFSRSRQR